MTYRGQEEHLRARNEELEEALEKTQEELQTERARLVAIADQARLVQETREKEDALVLRQRKRQRMKDNVSTVIRAVLVLVVGLAGAIGLFASIKEASQAHRDQRQEEVAAHQAMLADLRQHVPAGVDERDWLWCVDHCVRFSNVDGFYVSEGVVVDTFINYAADPPTGLINIEGPWINSAGHQTMTAAPTPQEMDSVVPFQVGQLVRLSYRSDNRGYYFTYSRIHPPEE
jgi:hypothetical protein